MRLLRSLLVVLLVAIAAPAAAQTFPALTGRVVDAANLLSPQQEQQLTQQLAALERASSRQLVVATVPSLEDRPIEDYGYQLGRHWGLGQRGANNGTILLIAPNERRVRVEVGYGLEPILTDAFTNRVIDEQIVPRFRENDMAGGIMAGTAALVEQLGAPPEQAEQRAVQAAERQRSRGSGGGGSFIGLVFVGIVLLFILVPLIRRGRRGRRYGTRGRRRGWGGAPVLLWGGGGGGWGPGGGWGSGGGGWGGGGGGGDFGGFSGGGGSFGGGGASGSW
jgi:uncharacterized protein